MTRQPKVFFVDTQHFSNVYSDQTFICLCEYYATLQETATEELLLPFEPDHGNVEYKLKLQSLTMDRVDHLTT